ncbi:pyridoxal-phosphate dependent enzyme [Catenulispora sp. NF23]|uniref:Pyridoxal-phosphate dependent enzyme n=1 Tax=Catenulispora pinistramenti TaxID=2705254 RepID=A0ABS5L7D2_9ACTN|nr:pyridoxal-phosphate dependent enzyme [Catenulispora pinistramenti]MBS2539271.1 pyridoxal-phosphate dependent enzyme [Catenulispora pinistramenti]MBS2554247.1 pyridoxal-phosphate dependent enzyme [Catenulispora pinistramenti]
MTSSTAIAEPRTGRPFSSVVEATELPRIIRLTDNLYAAAFSLMKLLPARYIIARAEAAGLLTPGTPVLETSSGTFGLGLALVCGLRGYPLTIVGDAAVDAELKTRLEMLGARVEIVAENGHPGGIQGARLDRLEQLRRENPGSFVPNQYGNPDNGRSYEIVGDLVLDTVGAVDCLVGPVGSGGSSGGLARALRAARESMHLIGVDTHGSTIFGQPAARRLLRGLGSSIHPDNVHYTAYDEVHWVTAEEAFRATHALYRRHALFMGPTSGASFLAAAWWARLHPERKVLAVLPDEGYRYQQTVYNAEWLSKQDMDMAERPQEPLQVSHPLDAPGQWTRLAWARRSYAEVMGAGARQ